MCSTCDVIELMLLKKQFRLNVSAVTDTVFQVVNRTKEKIGESILLVNLIHSISRETVKVLEKTHCFVPRNIFGSCESRLETGFQHFEILLRNELS
jgi:hypothetical protein